VGRCLANKPAWNVLVWFATLVVLADGLNKVGFVGWFGQHAAALLADTSPSMVMVLLVVLFFVIHYLFASLTAHTTAVLPVILAAGMAVPEMPNASLRPAARVFHWASWACRRRMRRARHRCTTAADFLSRKDFWRLGFIFGMIFLSRCSSSACRRFSRFSEGGAPSPPRALRRIFGGRRSAALRNGYSMARSSRW
jgi:L-tartrate/succinate antiporter